MQHIHSFREGLIQGVITEHLTELKHFRVRFIGRIREDTPHQEIILQVCRIQFPTERSVHIEYRNTVCDRDIVGGIGIRHFLDIGNQCL